MKIAGTVLSPVTDFNVFRIIAPSTPSLFTWWFNAFIQPIFKASCNHSTHPYSWSSFEMFTLFMFLIIPIKKHPHPHLQGLELSAHGCKGLLGNIAVHTVGGREHHHLNQNCWKTTKILVLGSESSSSRSWSYVFCIFRCSCVSELKNIIHHMSFKKSKNPKFKVIITLFSCTRSWNLPVALCMSSWNFLW